MAPEFFTDLQEGYGYEVDYYAFGILLYEMVVGSPPFGYETGKDDAELKKEIKDGIKPSQLEKVSDKKLRDLIERLLEKDKNKRLGNKDGFNEITKHPFFEDFAAPKEVEDFIAAKEDSEVPFLGLQARCELYLETAYLSGIRPENPYDRDVDDDNDPFKEF